MAEALYRKYRSKSLDEVIGQEHITKTLQRALKNGSTSHAYLFTGPRGVGKTSIARILAHEVNKLAYENETVHLDIIEIDAASNRRIDDIRDLREKVHIAPVSAPYKVYIIDEVHMLTGESFNALLKTLEEPPEHVIFVLATTEVHKLPATVVSRTQRFHFRPIAKEKVIDHLASIAEKEGIKIDGPALELIAEHGEGSFRDSISLLDQLASMSGKKIDSTFVEEVLGLARQEDIEKVLNHIKSGNSEELSKTLNALENQGVSAVVFAGQLMRTLRKTTSEPWTYELLNDLLDIGKNPRGWLKLLVTLQKDRVPKKPVADLAEPKSKESSKEKPTTKAATISQPADATVKSTPKGIAANAKPLSIADWPKVLLSIKAKDRPLLSMLSKAEPRFTNSGLELALKSKLYTKKLDEPQYRKRLTRCIVNLGFSCGEISVYHDETASAFAMPADEPTEKAKSKAADVLKVMGGGEIMNGESPN